MNRIIAYKGQPIIDPETNRPYVEHEYSDGLLLALLKAHRPGKFREKIDAKQGDDGDSQAMPDEVKEALRRVEGYYLERMGFTAHGNADNGTSTNGAGGPH